ncbi:MAG: HAD family hydrolase [Oscillospiraceae bacterium]|nr:HAD family hydrolase [Oscillospiraceae bacterium]
MKLIFLDIDGTLTEPGRNTPPQSALDAIRAARAAGNKVFLCSGRNYAMLSPLLQYAFDGYIGSAGGYVVSDGKVLYDHPMTEEQFRTAAALLRESGALLTIEAKDGSYCDAGIADLLGRVSKGNSELMRWRRALEEELNILPMEQYRGDPIYKIIFYCERAEQLDSARAALEKDFNFVVQDGLGFGVVNGELINRSFHKGQGVEIVAQELGVPIADTVGFGDSMNDLEMIETVGTSICMANGSETLKQRADMVCPAVTEDGLARAFRTLGLC